MRRVTTLALLCLAFACALPGAASAQRLLVELAPGAPAGGGAAAASLLQSPAPAVSLLGGWVAVELPPGVSPSAAGRVLERALPWVADWSADVPLRPAEVPLPQDPEFPNQWALRNTGQLGGAQDGDIDAPEAWAAAGALQPVLVAVIDTGVDTAHPDLAGVTAPGGWDFAAGDATVFDDPATDLHGTHVAGVVAAAAGNGVGIAGVAPNARLLPLKFMARGTGSTSAAMEAMAYALRSGARVVTAAWGTSQPSTALCDGVASVRAGGALVVAAAGNEGQDLSEHPFYPASCPGALPIAATDGADRIAAFSNRGGTVRLAAPGAFIVSTAPGDGVAWMSGTSMAVPQVAGVAALAWGVAPAATVDAVEAALLDGADGPNPLRLLPRVNATGTVARLRAAVVPTVRLDIVRPADGGSIVLAPGNRRIWVRVVGGTTPAELVVTVGRHVLAVATASLPSRPPTVAGSQELGIALPRLAVGAREVDVTAAGAERSATVLVHELQVPPRVPRVAVRDVGARTVQLRWPSVGRLGVPTRYRVLVNGTRAAETRKLALALRPPRQGVRVRVVVLGPDGLRIPGPVRAVRAAR